MHFLDIEYHNSSVRTTKLVATGLIGDIEYVYLLLLSGREEILLDDCLWTRILAQSLGALSSHPCGPKI